MLKFSQKAQSTVEYAVLISVVVSGLLITQVYLKRGLQGKLRDSTDQIGEQYSPGRTTSNILRKSFTLSEDTVKETISTSNIKDGSFQTRNGFEELEVHANELWPGTPSPTPK